MVERVVQQGPDHAITVAGAIGTTTLTVANVKLSVIPILGRAPEVNEHQRSRPHLVAPPLDVG
jgi:hypothetical protein